MAQTVTEVLTAATDSVTLINGVNGGTWDVDEDGTQRVAQGALVPMLVKAIQEQNALIEALTTRITTLEG